MISSRFTIEVRLECVFGDERCSELPWIVVLAAYPRTIPEINPRAPCPVAGEGGTWGGGGAPHLASTARAATDRTSFEGVTGQTAVDEVSGVRVTETPSQKKTRAQNKWI